MCEGRREELRSITSCPAVPAFTVCLSPARSSGSIRTLERPARISGWALLGIPVSGFMLPAGGEAQGTDVFGKRAESHSSPRTLQGGSEGISTQTSQNTQFT